MPTGIWVCSTNTCLFGKTRFWIYLVILATAAVAQLPNTFSIHVDTYRNVKKLELVVAHRLSTQ